MPKKAKHQVCPVLCMPRLQIKESMLFFDESGLRSRCCSYDLFPELTAACWSFLEPRRLVLSTLVAVFAKRAAARKKFTLFMAVGCSGCAPCQDDLCLLWLGRTLVNKATCFCMFPSIVPAGNCVCSLISKHTLMRLIAYKTTNLYYTVGQCFPPLCIGSSHI